jgi:hypothetical protein
VPLFEISVAAVTSLFASDDNSGFRRDCGRHDNCSWRFAMMYGLKTTLKLSRLSKSFAGQHGEHICREAGKSAEGGEQVTLVLTRAPSISGIEQSPGRAICDAYIYR